jgi:cysteine desulfurase
MSSIYLDHNATTPIDPDAFNAMLPFLREEFGNPSSTHALGKRAHDAVERARAQVAALIGAQASEIVFTSGGTEASNIAIRGAVARDPNRNAVVTTAIEHPATDACCALLEGQGHPVARIRPALDGVADPEAVAAAVSSRTAILSIIHAQNEIGTIQPIAQIAHAARRHGALVHADAAQSLGKVAFTVDGLGVDLLSIAGHKLYAPKGIGALYVRRGVNVPSVLRGAGQESGRRPGTENVAGIVALGEACRIAARHLEKGTAAMAALTAALLSHLKRLVPGIVCVGENAARLPNTLNVLFPDVSGRRLLQSCPRVLASNGSACHADSEEPSAILIALGIPRHQALGTVRLSLGRSTTAQDVEDAASSLAAAWHHLRTSSPIAAE